MLTWIISDFFKTLIDNQILQSVLKGFISVFTEMYFDGVSGIPQLPFETVGLLPVFGFCHILLLYIIRAHRLVLYALTLCCVIYSVAIVVMVISTNRNSDKTLLL